ncbi:hypothetical protein L7E55_16030 [Pelotomaculum isophthalicicum JI]|uniref:Uncharacterized protein n=1 Tax=Pelotomaculum isophthalicicum JI TaxID=947010 RepID=A0A9X4JWP3_9FIRM|nr:hypothetical protein [Pelotomaculum isophthalicicum]MDF9409837.1 hypothetical protein [Pelotomaculum isophthalicicum JI]
MDYFDLREIRDMASVALVAGSSAPLLVLSSRMINITVVIICLLNTCNLWLLFRGTSKNGAIALVEQGP